MKSSPFAIAAFALTAAVCFSAAALAGGAPPTYREFMKRARFCDSESARGIPEPSAGMIPSRLGEWNRCMAPVADRMTPAQHETLAAGMRACNASTPYAVRPGDNIACLRRVIRKVFSGPADIDARTRMVGAEIAGRCEQRYPNDENTQLKCIHEGLHDFSASGFRGDDGESNAPPPAAAASAAPSLAPLAPE
jgi:hypothetical protein